MAARLTVIISQSAIRHSRASDAEEALLTELLMTPGLDATLIGSLDEVQIDSTDYLCLSGFTQHVALVSSLTVPEVAQHWERLDLGGHVVSLGQTNGAPGRRVYCLSLELGTVQILAQLRQLLDDRSVQTVNLSLPVMPKPASPSAPVEAEVPRNRNSSSPPAVAAKEGVSAPALSTDDSQSRNNPLRDSENSDEEWPNLDQLVDDFDALDL